MHHKRKKTKKSVRCSICTTHRWKGNSKDRVRPGVRRQMQSED